MRLLDPWADDLLKQLRLPVALLSLAARGRYRPRSRYWRWRRETAFGGPRKLTRRERAHAQREFALWARAMRRHTGR